MPVARGLVLSNIYQLRMSPANESVATVPNYSLERSLVLNRLSETAPAKRGCRLSSRLYSIRPRVLSLLSLSRIPDRTVSTVITGHSAHARKGSPGEQEQAMRKPLLFIIQSGIAL